MNPLLSVSTTSPPRITTSEEPNELTGVTLYLYWKIFRKKSLDVYDHGYGVSGEYRLSYEKKIDWRADPHLSSRFKAKTVKSLLRLSSSIVRHLVGHGHLKLGQIAPLQFH